MTRVQVGVVGRGLIGSAAARHLAEDGVTVALIGPGEPADRLTSEGPFSSHADQARITRVAGRTGIWSEVAARSIARYGDIADRSGIDFHVGCGLAVSFDDADRWAERGHALGSDARLVSVDWLRSTTGIDVTNGKPILFEGAPSGYINPLRMVAAQTKLVSLAGGVVIEDPVTGLIRERGSVTLSGPFGSVSAERVLLATGAFGSELLDIGLDVDRRPRSILKAEMAADARIPSLILDGPPDDRLHEIYWVPPVRYPDGSLRLKIGGNLKDHDWLEPDDLAEWFHGHGSAVEVEALENSLRSLLPQAEFLSFTQSPCVITGTPTGHPYIGWVDDAVAVAIAGNGSAAKSADELGRLAATLFSEAGWSDSLNHDDFAPKFVQ